MGTSRNNDDATEKAWPFLLLGFGLGHSGKFGLPKQDTPGPPMPLTLPQQSFVAAFQPPKKLLEAHYFLRELTASKRRWATSIISEGV
jgi:hypothetical protein